MRRLFAMTLFALAMPAAADVVMTTSRGVVVAHDGVVELFDEAGTRLWSVPGVPAASAIAVGEERIAVIDSWTNRIRLVRLRDGHGEDVTTGETPVDALFLGEDLFLLERDARRLLRVAVDGSRTPVAVAADPVFVRHSAGRLYVYSRLDGLLQEIDPSGRLLRQAAVGASASDLEIAGRTAYLLFPRSARLTGVDLEKLAIRRSSAAGGTPADLAIVRGASALTAPLIAIADPAAKRLWMVEGAQSVGGAFGRGFLRGLLGLGLFRSRSSDFPTGIDRVVSTGRVTVAFDSATGTLYRVAGRRSRTIAEGLTPHGFAVIGERVAIWSDDRLRFEN